ncbi:hypothetical protein SAMN04488057_12130 [Cyclobacterium lianum]|uniref:Outer membrane protein beta-barrel domain-containing protein n=1 Tax=Cyclobacterium lianum TaxID=388280 RepID=A0A1M7QPH1_9BACT|nr:hypothetical protein [Cyclobacterium lianum]SHN33156.1 hypothetical protein SAMN04488057_12130 [Cyclobacterium lianum]
MEKNKTDRLIKEKLEAWHPVFTEAAWDDFAPHLQNSYWWKSWWGLTTIAGILAIGMYLLYSSTLIENPGDAVRKINSEGSAALRSSEIPAPSNPSALDSLDDNPESDRPASIQASFDKRTRSAINIVPDGKASVANSRTNIQAVEAKAPDAVFPNGLVFKKYYETTHSEYKARNHYADLKLIQHLLGIEEKSLDQASASVKGTGNLFEIKESAHWDLSIGPQMNWLYPVDGFSTTRLPFSEELFSWRAPGIGIALELNQKWSFNTGITGAGTSSYITVGEGYPTQKLLHFPDWSEVNYVVDHIRIENRQLFIPLTLRYQQKIFGNFGLAIHSGLVVQHLGNQDFLYSRPGVSSSPSFATATDQQKWQLSYSQFGMGFYYRLSKRLSAYLNGDYWYAIQPIGGERHRYQLAGLSLGINYHLFPRKQ